MIQAPVTARFASATKGDRSSWRHLARGEQPRPGEVTRVRMVGVRPAHVWDVSQTSGEPLPALPRPMLLKGAAPPGLWDGLARLVRDAGFRLGLVPHSELAGGANGVSRFDDRVVAVRQEMDPAAQVKTLAHELAHVMLHGLIRREDFHMLPANARPPA
ncbi:ImmA/IrrE family metallo-endopeptidase [Microlunatus sp. GCM10028923]|uniref:ImmA/IrrE family metallo-endopeptidase n=1 Tax=Microlunatus sp. GCM10028923 TaxID=3273400 RepID=UPI0036194FDD